MLAGLFAVPVALLWAGHRLRRRPPRWRAAFWGALVGHLAGASLATAAALVPPSQWGPHDRWRGFFGFWAMLVAPLLGAAAAARGRRGAPPG